MHAETNSKFQIPNSNGKIFLIGMPGVGKTYWGVRIATYRGLPFADLDTFIEEQEKVSIADLFAQYGEDGFRERESKYLQQLVLTEGNVIVACGGGTPCFNNNMALMKAAGCVIYLQADIATLVAHIKNSNNMRPLLKGQGDMTAYLEDLLQKRSRFYEQADYILQTKDISLTTFDQIITSCINRQ